MHHDRRRSTLACAAINRNLHRRRLRETPKPTDPPPQPAEHVPRRTLTWPVLVFLMVSVAPLLWEAVAWGLGW